MRLLNPVKKKNRVHSKPKIRQAVVDDFDKVYPLLQQMNNTRLSKDDWFRLFQNHWSIKEFSPGIVLQLEDKIVGYIGTIYSKQIIAGKVQLCCNLSTWIVEDEYRSHSIIMLLPLVRNKELLLTSFSSNDVSYKVYKKLGFKDANTRKRIVYPFPSLHSSHYVLFTDISLVSDNLNQNDRVVFNDHKAFANTYVLIKHKNEYCLLMGECHAQLFKLTYVSNKTFLQQHLKSFRNKLMAKLQVKKMYIDEDLLEGVFLFLSRKVTWGNPYQYKIQGDVLLSPSPEYSEIFLLNM